MTDDVKCPNCGHNYEALTLANDKGIDVEGQMMYAPPDTFTCDGCGVSLQLTVEVFFNMIVVSKPSKEEI